MGAPATRGLPPKWSPDGRSFSDFPIVATTTMASRASSFGHLDKPSVGYPAHPTYPIREHR